MPRPCKFKVGDILKPIEGRISSNYHAFHDNLQIKVTGIAYDYYGNRYEIKSTIINGRTRYDGFKNKLKGDYIKVYENAFELTKPKENYPIF